MNFAVFLSFVLLGTLNCDHVQAPSSPSLVSSLCLASSLVNLVSLFFSNLVNLLIIFLYLLMI